MQRELYSVGDANAVSFRRESAAGSVGDLDRSRFLRGSYKTTLGVLSIHFDEASGRRYPPLERQGN